MGQFKKGEPRHPKAGRRRGTQNKSTEDLRKVFGQLLSNNIDRLQSDLDKLSPKDRLNAIIAIANYCIPKLAAVEADVSSERHITISDCTELGLP